MNQERLMNILISPHVSEKATNAAESANQIVFRVANTATKKEIKGAIEMLFEVCLLYTSPSPRDKRQSRMPSSA